MVSFGFLNVRKCRIILLLFALFSSITIFILYHHIDSTPALAIFCDIQFDAFVSAHRQCLSSRINTSQEKMWTTLNTAVHQCVNKSTWDSFGVNVLRNKDEDKFVILPSHKSVNSCIEITLGVGGDIEAEKKLLKLVPDCKLYGADPIWESGKIFKDVGEYFQTAVGSESGVIAASVLENGKYRNKNVDTMDFLHKRAKSILSIIYGWIMKEQNIKLFQNIDQSEYANLSMDCGNARAIGKVSYES